MRRCTGRTGRASDRGKPFFACRFDQCIRLLNPNLMIWLPRLIGAVAEAPAGRDDDEIVAKLAIGLQSLDSVSIPTMIAGGQPSYWFLRMQYRGVPGRVIVDKAAFCTALGAAGLPVVADYSAALPHTMDWFTNRRVFGTSGYPWTSPDYRGDRDRQFACPHAREAIASHFNVMIHEAWSDQDVEQAIAIFTEVEATFSERSQH